MRPAIYLALLFILTACVVAPKPDYAKLSGGERLELPGVSYTVPNGTPWSAIMRTTYETLIGRYGSNKNETFVVAVSFYNLPKPSPSKDEFLELIKESHANEPKTGRYEVLRSEVKLYDVRAETCVIHKSASKDFGAKAKRGGEYSFYETYGMNCVHPLKPNVGMVIELSRKAPPEMKFPEFNDMGSALLESVKFEKF